jgi:hypothetical protein
VAGACWRSSTSVTWQPQPVRFVVVSERGGYRAGYSPWPYGMGIIVISDEAVVVVGVFDNVAVRGC